MREHFRVDGPLWASVKLGTGLVAAETADSGAAWAAVEARDPAHAPSVQLAARAAIRLVGDQLRVELPDAGPSSRRAEVLVTVGLPAQSSLAVKGGAVDVTVRGGLGALAVKMGAGDVEIDAATRSVDIKAGRADVRIGAAGTVTLATGRGNLSVDQVGGATVKMGQGAVRLGRTEGAVVVKAGNVQLTVAEAGPGELALDTGAGSAVVGVAAGTTVQLDLMSAIGDVRCDLPLESTAPAGGAALRLRLRTGSGDLRVASTATAGR